MTDYKTHLRRFGVGLLYCTLIFTFTALGWAVDEYWQPWFVYIGAAIVLPPAVYAIAWVMDRD